MTGNEWRKYIGDLIATADAAKLASDLRAYEEILADAEMAMAAWREQATHERRSAGLAR